MPRLSAALVLIAALGLLTCTPVQAVQRAYVSVNGNDANTATGCPSTAPCRAFATAVTVLDPNGEVIAMDSGGFGAVTLSQSVTLSAAPGAYAGIGVLSGASGVTIATAGINVVLRGLTIGGIGGTYGVSVTNAASVSIENCVIANFSGSGGAAISVNGPVPVRIVDSVLRNNYDGLIVQGGATADVSRARLLGNSDVGLYVLGNTAGTTTTLVVGESLVTGSGSALRAEANQATAVVRTEVTESSLLNSGYGAAAMASAGSVFMAVNDTLVTGNGVGLYQTGAGATLKSLGNNTVTGNTQDTSGTITPFSPIPNDPPSVALTSPASGQSFTAPASIVLTANASDPNGNLARVEFYQGSTLLGSATNPPYTYTWSNVPVGNYTLSARASDTLGAQASSPPVSIAVTAAVYYIHADHLNTPRLVTDAQNRIVWRNLPTTEPFGNAAPEENPSGLGAFTFNLRFPGQYFDKETQSHYNTFRDYDPATGRYPQADPIGLAGGSMSLYTYAGGNPLSYVDPTGEAIIVPILIGAALIGGTQSTTFQNAAANAAQYWANLAAQSSNPIIAFGLNLLGATAALAGPCTINATASVLGVGAGLGGYFGRPFWQYYPAGNNTYNSLYLTRGWGWSPPLPLGQQAVQKLALPPYNPATAVKAVTPPPLQFVGGPGRVPPMFGQPGGGIQYKIGGAP